MRFQISMIKIILAMEQICEDAFLMSGPSDRKGVMSYEYNGNPDVVTSYIFRIIIY